MKIRKTLRGLTLVLALNQAIPTFVSPISMTLSGLLDGARKSSKECAEQYKNLPKDFDTLDYLNLSNSIVNRFATQGDDCKHRSQATFDIFMKLVEANERGDLRKRVRLVMGFDEDYGHCYLEFNENGKFIPYETTDYTPKLYLDEVKKYSKDTRTFKVDDAIRTKWIAVRSFAGTKIPHACLESIIMPGGVLRLPYTLYQMKSKII